MLKAQQAKWRRFHKSKWAFALILLTMLVQTRKGIHLTLRKYYLLNIYENKPEEFLNNKFYKVNKHTAFYDLHEVLKIWKYVPHKFLQILFSSCFHIFMSVFRKMHSITFQKKKVKGLLLDLFLAIYQKGFNLLYKKKKTNLCKSKLIKTTKKQICSFVQENDHHAFCYSCTALCRNSLKALVQSQKSAHGRK